MLLASCSRPLSGFTARVATGENCFLQGSAWLLATTLSFVSVQLALGKTCAINGSITSICVSLSAFVRIANLNPLAWLTPDVAAANMASIVPFVSNSTNIVICEGFQVNETVFLVQYTMVAG